MDVNKDDFTLEPYGSSSESEFGRQYPAGNWGSDDDELFENSSTSEHTSSSTPENRDQGPRKSNDGTDSQSSATSSSFRSGVAVKRSAEVGSESQQEQKVTSEASIPKEHSAKASTEPQQDSYKLRFRFLSESEVVEAKAARLAAKASVESQQDSAALASIEAKKKAKITAAMALIKLRPQQDSARAWIESQQAFAIASMEAQIVKDIAKLSGKFQKDESDPVGQRVPLIRSIANWGKPLIKFTPSKSLDDYKPQGLRNPPPWYVKLVEQFRAAPRESPGLVKRELMVCDGFTFGYLGTGDEAGPSGPQIFGTDGWTKTFKLMWKGSRSPFDDLNEIMKREKKYKSSRRF